MTTRRGDGVQVGHRILRNHANGVAAQLNHPLFACVGDVLAIEQDLSAGHLPVRGQESDCGKCRGGFSGPRLAYDGYGFTRHDGQVRVADRLDIAAAGFEGDGEVEDFEQGRGS